METERDVWSSENVFHQQSMRWISRQCRNSLFKLFARYCLCRSCRNDNYEHSIQILKRRFGDQNLIKTALYQQFSDTRSAGPQLNGIRTAVKMINKICKRLNAYKKEINYPRRVALIEKWLPPEIPIELEETKLVCPDWNIRILMSLERNFIN